jgi:DUF1680 family protein
MERVIYNTVLGALPLHRDGRAFYYSDYTRNARKAFHWDRWPCCSGTLPLLAADYAIGLCFTDPLGLYVNLYAPAQVAWDRGGITCRLEMTTDYPYDGTISLLLSLPTPLRFILRLRIPAWASSAQAHINGQSNPAICVPGTFAAIDREWQPGDRVDLQLSMPLRLLKVDSQHPQTVALVAGPLVLMRVLDADAEADPETEAAPAARELLSARRLYPTAREWQVQTPRRTLRFRPFMDIHDQGYRVYQDIVEDAPKL